MKVRIDSEGKGLLDAIEFAAEHVIVKRADLDKIAALARKLRVFRKFKALGVQMQEIEITGMAEPRPDPRPARKRARKP